MSAHSRAKTGHAAHGARRLYVACCARDAEMGHAALGARRRKEACFAREPCAPHSPCGRVCRVQALTCRAMPSPLQVWSKILVKRINEAGGLQT